MIYEGTIQFIGVNPKTGSDVTKKESYVLENALSFSDAEVSLFDFADGLTDVDVVALRRSSIKEILNERENDAQRLWLVELMDIFHSDEGVEKQLRYKVLLYSETFDTAKKFIGEYIKQGYDMQLISLRLTKFIDVLK